VALQTIMRCFPSSHYVNLAQAILYRCAGFDVVWPDLAAVTAIGAIYFLVAGLRFRKTVALAGS
jgi:ABC-2 type transport system permease protein